jgi:hypothetical protein
VTAPAHRGRRDNGLTSEAFAPVADVDPRLGDHLLDVLGLQEIPAYIEPAPASKPVVADRLFVAAGQTNQARRVLDQLAGELGIEIARGAHPEPYRSPADPLDDLDTDAEFAAIIANMPELDRSPLTDTSGGLLYPEASTGPVGRHDDIVEHFVPPPAPPLPRLSVATAIAVVVTLLGIAIIAVGGMFGLPSDLPLPLGVMFILAGSGLLFQRLRRGDTDDPEDDGAIV